MSSGAKPGDAELVGGVGQNRLATQAGDAGMGFVVFREFLQQLRVGIEADAATEVAAIMGFIALDDVKGKFRPHF